LEGLYLFSVIKNYLMTSRGGGQKVAGKKTSQPKNVATEKRRVDANKNE
jgi:hypothetical protein